METALESPTGINPYAPELRASSESGAGADGGAASQPTGERPLGDEPREILLVEDEDAIRSLSIRLLTGAGYRVIAARTGTEALALAEAHPGISLVVTDVLMPGMNGYELGDRLRERRPELPMIYMSGYVETGPGGPRPLPTRALFLPKPFTAQALLTQVRQLLNT